MRDGALVHCISCFRSGVDAIWAATGHFVGVVVLWKQMVRRTSVRGGLNSFSRNSLFASNSSNNSDAAWLLSAIFWLLFSTIVLIDHLPFVAWLRKQYRQRLLKTRTCDTTARSHFSSTDLC